MEEQKLYHIQERVIIAIQNGQWHKTNNNKNQLHGLPSNTAQISMRDSIWSMEEQELSHIQEKDTTATQNGQWHKTKKKKNQLHGLP